MSGAVLARAAVLALILAPGAAWAQASETIDATATIQPAAPTVALSQTSEVVLGSVFSSREDGRTCEYELKGDGRFIVSGTNSTGGATGDPAARGGCGLSGRLAPSPGRVAVACAPGANIAFVQRISTSGGLAGLASVEPLIRMDESDPGRTGLVSQNNVTCPAGGRFLIDFGVKATFGTGVVRAQGTLAQLVVAVQIQ